MSGFEFLQEATVRTVFLVVLVTILVDTALGILRTFKPDQPNFDLRLLPKFLAENVFPYIGGLLVLALAAEFMDAAFGVIFYAAATSVFGKYITEIKDKGLDLFGS